MTIFAGIAEFERDLIRERTSAGREAAQKRGVRFGRPRKLSMDQEQLARRLILEGKAVSGVARTFNVHAATIYRLADADSSDFQIASACRAKAIALDTAESLAQTCPNMFV